MKFEESIIISLYEQRAYQHDYKHTRAFVHGAQTPHGSIRLYFLLIVIELLKLADQQVRSVPGIFFGKI